MNEREKKIVEAAISVISRYGFRKTTMGDIAKEAGLSRQTVYAVFPSKEDILHEGMRITWKDAVERIRLKCRDLDALDEKLDIFFQHAVIDFHDLICRMPDANDLITGFSPPGSEVYGMVLAQQKILLLELLQPYEALLVKHGQDADSVAEFVQHSASNFKYIAKDRAHLRRLIGSLKSAVLALTKSAA